MNEKNFYFYTGRTPRPVKVGEEVILLSPRHYALLPDGVAKGIPDLAKKNPPNEIRIALAGEEQKPKMVIEKSKVEAAVEPIGVDGPKKLSFQDSIVEMGRVRKPGARGRATETPKEQ
jgi:hypothetical protein